MATQDYRSSDRTNIPDIKWELAARLPWSFQYEPEEINEMEEAQANGDYIVTGRRSGENLFERFGDQEDVSEVIPEESKVEALGHEWGLGGQNSYRMKTAIELAKKNGNSQVYCMPEQMEDGGLHSYYEDIETEGVSLEPSEVMDTELEMIFLCEESNGKTPVFTTSYPHAIRGRDYMDNQDRVDDYIFVGAPVFESQEELWENIRSNEFVGSLPETVKIAGSVLSMKKNSEERRWRDIEEVWEKVSKRRTGIQPE